MSPRRRQSPPAEESVEIEAAILPPLLPLHSLELSPSARTTPSTASLAVAEAWRRSGRTSYDNKRSPSLDSNSSSSSSSSSITVRMAQRNAPMATTVESVSYDSSSSVEQKNTEEAEDPYKGYNYVDSPAVTAMQQSLQTKMLSTPKSSPTLSANVGQGLGHGHGQGLAFLPHPSEGPSSANVEPQLASDLLELGLGGGNRLDEDTAERKKQPPKSGDRHSKRKEDKSKKAPLESSGMTAPAAVPKSRKPNSTSESLEAATIGSPAPADARGSDPAIAMPQPLVGANLAMPTPHIPEPIPQFPIPTTQPATMAVTAAAAVGPQMPTPMLPLPDAAGGPAMPVPTVPVAEPVPPPSMPIPEIRQGTSMPIPEVCRTTLMPVSELKEPLSMPLPEKKQPPSMPVPEIKLPPPMPVPEIKLPPPMPVPELPIEENKMPQQEVAGEANKGPQQSPTRPGVSYMPLKMPALDLPAPSPMPAQMPEPVPPVSAANQTPEQENREQNRLPRLSGHEEHLAAPPVPMPVPELSMGEHAATAWQMGVTPASMPSTVLPGKLVEMPIPTWQWPPSVIMPNHQRGYELPPSTYASSSAVSSSLWSTDLVLPPNATQTDRIRFTSRIIVRELLSTIPRSSWERIEPSELSGMLKDTLKRIMGASSSSVAESVVENGEERQEQMQSMGDRGAGEDEDDATTVKGGFKSTYGPARGPVPMPQPHAPSQLPPFAVQMAPPPLPQMYMPMPMPTFPQHFYSQASPSLPLSPQFPYAPYLSPPLPFSYYSPAPLPPLPSFIASPPYQSQEPLPAQVADTHREHNSPPQNSQEAPAFQQSSQEREWDAQLDQSVDEELRMHGWPPSQPQDFSFALNFSSQYATDPTMLQNSWVEAAQPPFPPPPVMMASNGWQTDAVYAQEPVPLPSMPHYLPPLPASFAAYPYVTAAPPPRAWADSYARHLGSIAASARPRQPGPVASELEREKASSRTARKAYDKLTHAQRRLQAAVPLGPYDARELDDRKRRAETAEEDFGRGQGLRDRVRMEDAYRQAYVPVGLRRYDGPTRGWDLSQKPREVRWTERKIERGGSMPGAFPSPLSPLTRGNSRKEELPVWTNFPGWTFAQQRLANGGGGLINRASPAAGQETTEMFAARFSTPTAAPIHPREKFNASKDAVTPYGMPEHSLVVCFAWDMMLRSATSTEHLENVNLGSGPIA